LDQACRPADDTPGLYHYEFKVTSGSLESLALALVGFAGTLTTKENVVTADLDADGHPESFHSCASHEGVHLTVWKGKPL